MVHHQGPPQFQPRNTDEFARGWTMVDPHITLEERKKLYIYMGGEVDPPARSTPSKAVIVRISGVRYGSPVDPSNSCPSCYGRGLGKLVALQTVVGDHP